MKVLLVSHNSFSTHQSMGKTFLSLFSSFSKEELCQLYIYPTIPDVDVCSSYYRVTDKDVLAGLLPWRKVGGEIPKDKIQTAKSVLFENDADITLYRRRGNQDASKRLLRDMLWRLSRWYTKDLKAWLDREAPTCIFVAPGYAKFIYDIALTIASERNIPIVTYICDDYYFVKTPQSVIGKWQLALLKKKTDTLLKKSDHLVTICEEIKAEYQQHFAIPATVIMTGTNYGAEEATTAQSDPKAICFFGNIGCRRDQPLAEIGRALDEINREQGTAYRLKVYTASPSPEVVSLFGAIDSIELCGFVTGEAFEKTFQAADLLLHVEAFDDAAIDTVKHSVSTKIADSLASGIPLVAYAPAQVASMAHLRRHSCALTATSKEELKPMLLTAFGNAKARKLAVKNARTTAAAYHDSASNSIRLHGIFDDI